MLSKIRKSYGARVLSAVMVPFMFGVAPSFASPAPRGNGALDPNLAGADVNELVNVSSGDFSYSIPLMDVGGYPITLSYNPDVSMETEASVVGLGWNISTGAVNRVVRGIPDDFYGDKITTTMNLRPTLNLVNGLKLSLELAGLEPGLGITGGVTFNNYTGNETSIGAEVDFGLGSIGEVAQFTGTVGVNSSSRSGLSKNVGVGLALGKGKSKVHSNLGLNQNTLHGSSLSFNYGYTRELSQKALQKGDNKGKRVNKGALGAGGSFPLGAQSYTPTANFNFTNRTFSADINAGTELFFVVPHLKYSWTKSQYCLAETEKSQSAYGYMNLESGYDANAIQDFNLSMPSVHEEVNALNTPIPTYDFFTVSTSGKMFRAMRNDAGYVKDPATRSSGNATSVSGEVGVGSGFEVGVNTSFNWNNSTTGDWITRNAFSEDERFKFDATTPSQNQDIQRKYEKFAFQEVNNTSTITSSQFDALKGKKAITQGIHLANGNIKGDGFFTDDSPTNYDVTNNQHYQNERRDRQTIFQHLTNGELRNMGTASFNVYPENNHAFNSGTYLGAYVPRAAAQYPEQHIGEITVIAEGGSAEVYGIPVMNESQQVSFNISKINNGNLPQYTPDAMGLISYSPGHDNSVNNKRGNNFYYLKNQVPTHATSYLLTAMKSSDYVDRTNNGFTPDDIGDYVKFNYTDLGKTKWRYPYQQNKATFNEGFKSNPLDDMASYQYGTRDTYLQHSIESKDFVAEFVYGTRQDGFEVAGENGGISTTNRSRKLEQIKLYTRLGKERGEGPIKTVNFVYDQDLCPGIPDNNNNGGKLTLKEVYFQHYDSYKGKLHRYRFDYSPVNPSYDLSHKDRWGCYKEDNTGVSYDENSALDNNEYPYAEQDLNKANGEIQAWKLVGIETPNGSKIEVEYEADSYEFVQDHEATRMYKILGFYSWRDDLYVPTADDFTDTVYRSNIHDRFFSIGRIRRCDFWIRLFQCAAVDGGRVHAQRWHYVLQHAFQFSTTPPRSRRP